MEPATRWVTLTNLVLGATTLVVLAGVVVAMVADLIQNRRIRKMTLLPRDGETLKELRITMTDGGKPIDEFSLLDTKERERH